MPAVPKPSRRKVAHEKRDKKHRTKRAPQRPVKHARIRRATAPVVPAAAPVNRLNSGFAKVLAFAEQLKGALTPAMVRAECQRVGLSSNTASDYVSSLRKKGLFTVSLGV